MTAPRESGELRKKGLRIRLQEQPLQVLLPLLERPGRVVTREELRKKIWHDHYVDFDQGLNRAINKIRESLGDSAENPRFIESPPKRGYRFAATGETVDSAIRRVDSLAVLPFACSVQDVEAEGLCDGITASLIDQLSQLSDLRVISHYSVERYRGTRRTFTPLAVRWASRPSWWAGWSSAPTIWKSDWNSSTPGITATFGGRGTRGKRVDSCKATSPT